jgi:nicotinamidase/pyrazinamidase
MYVISNYPFKMSNLQVRTPDQVTPLVTLPTARTHMPWYRKTLQFFQPVNPVFNYRTITKPNGKETIILVIVDVQNDFCAKGGWYFWKKGSLYVNGAEKVAKIINEIRAYLEANYNVIVVLTKDWHPQNHCSFKSNNPGKDLFTVVELTNPSDMSKFMQMMWPDHCVQGTWGSDVVSDLRLDGSEIIVPKGTNRWVDSYGGGGSEDLVQENTGLLSFLQGLIDNPNINVKAILHTGVASDYCVDATARQIRTLGKPVIVVESACAGVAPESTAIAIAKMKAVGIQITPDLAGLKTILLSFR